MVPFQVRANHSNRPQEPSAPLAPPEPDLWHLQNKTYSTFRTQEPTEPSIAVLRWVSRLDPAAPARDCESRESTSGRRTSPSGRRPEADRTSSTASAAG